MSLYISGDKKFLFLLWPCQMCALVDGHISRLGENFLVYANDPAARWDTGLDAPHNTSAWQFHDNERQNGMLKKALAYERAWSTGRGAASGGCTCVPPHNIEFIYEYRIYAEAALSRRGRNPFNRATLGIPEVLETPTEEVKKSTTLFCAARGLAIPM